MARPTTETLTPRELRLMECLWDGGPSTADRVRERLADGSHDSSVRTLLRVLEEKGYVAREPAGKAHRYSAAVAREAVQSRAAGSLLRQLFRGSAAGLVLRLLEDEILSPEELRRLAEEARPAPGTPTPETRPRRRKPS